VEVHPDGAPLNSYYSEQEAKVANIVIRRAQLPGAFGDVGFVRQPDGRFTLIEDELDDHSGYGKKWLGRVQQIYKESQTLAVAQDYSEEDRRRLWREIQEHLDFAVLGRFNEAQPSGLPLRTSRSQALRVLTSRYDVKDFGPQSVEVTVHPDGRAEVTGFPVFGLPW
jgi:hypothetical protein